MNKLTKIILKKFIKDYENTKEPNVRVKYGFLEAWISIIGNIVIFGFKIIFGFVLNSISLIADSFHTLSDVITSLVVLFGFRTSRRPADTKHPYGHGRGESIATLIIGILLIIVGVDFLKLSFNRLIHPQVVKGSWLIAGLLILSALAKEMMAIFSIDLGKEINSSTLIADAWHHRSDAIASFLVAGAIVSSIFGYHKVDALFGIIISLIIIYVGINLSKSSASFLLGEAPSKDLVNKVERCTKSVEGVVNVHDIQVHNYGNRLEVSLHIEVNKGYALVTSHKIADLVEKKLFEELGVSSVVHVDP
ncbi:MAG TPA: cation transporter, partial [Elusimicrobia bacterium]|nr:cation transporter [Elusimicrobiota bacterium]